MAREGPRMGPEGPWVAVWMLASKSKESVSETSSERAAEAAVSAVVYVKYYSCGSE
jgi:hypothetical protein